jgi:ribonuclease HII
MPLKSPARRSTARPPGRPQKNPNFRRELEGVICGCDEAGRGPLAGPVSAACVFVPHEKRSHRVWKKVRDSKLLETAEREDLYTAILEHACFGIATASVAEIDAINILQAAVLAMRRATEDLCRDFGICPDLVLIDGNYKPVFPYPVQTVVKGDMLSVSIAAASILAKVTRDRTMHALHEAHPHYGWNTNVGYSTPTHLKALREHGPCLHHRRAFAKVKELLAA